MQLQTWTLANKKLKQLKSGLYDDTCVLKYESYGAIVCPDGTLIEEPCYKGDNIFAEKNVYELAADWNRAYLMDILNNRRFSLDYAFIICYGRKIWAAYAKDDKDALEAAIADAAIRAPSIEKDWKHMIGVAIACGKNNKIIPFPIKIVDTQKPKPYAKLHPSISLQ